MTETMMTTAAEQHENADAPAAASSTNPEPTNPAAPSRFAKYRQTRQDQDKMKRKNKIGASLNKLSLDDDDDDFLLPDAGGAVGVGPPATTPPRRRARQRPGTAGNKKKARSKSHMDSLDEDIELNDLYRERDALAAQSEHVPKKSSRGAMKSTSEHSRTALGGGAKKKASPSKNADNVEQYTENLNDTTATSSSHHSRTTARRRMSSTTASSTHSRSDSIDSMISDTVHTATSSADDSRQQSKRSTKKMRNRSTSRDDMGSGSDHGGKSRRGKSSRKKANDNSIDGYGSDHGMKRRTKKVRDKEQSNANKQQQQQQESIDGYGSDHGMKRRVKSTRGTKASSKVERKASKEIDGYGSDHGMKRRVRAERGNSKSASDEDDDDEDLTKSLQRQNSSGRLSRLLDFIPGRSKRRLDGSKEPAKDKSERKRSSSIGAMARRIGRRSERRMTRAASQRSVAQTAGTGGSDEENGNGRNNNSNNNGGGGMEAMRSPPRRHKSMDAGHVAGKAAVDGIHPPELFEDGRDPTVPVRAQSMMMHRERTRRGKSDSLHNLQEYTEQEIPSTSYFASNHILLNRERMKRGMKPLTRNKAMDELAREHAENMAKSLGCTPLKATFIGNVVRGESIRAVHRAVMQNRDGRERYNILNPYFQEFGIGTCKGEDGMLYVCQLFSESIELACVDTAS
mmetsp:Transcript_8019/g.23042  ORF Transcript_8019/g.23042 Transcript_8019/m.23042 type:complete len:683 (-) Transcript_8019:268-2316(-)